MRIQLAIALALASQPLMLGCSETYRYVTVEHWHDRDTLVISYTEHTREHYVVTTTGVSSTHVLICQVAADNSLQCREQPELDRAINGERGTVSAAAAGLP